MGWTWWGYWEWVYECFAVVRRLCAKGGKGQHAAGCDTAVCVHLLSGVFRASGIRLNGDGLLHERVMSRDELSRTRVFKAYAPRTLDEICNGLVEFALAHTCICLLNERLGRAYWTEGRRVVLQVLDHCLQMRVARRKT